MHRSNLAFRLAAIAAAAAALAACGSMMSRPDMTFFVSSTGSGKGGDLGGAAGADRFCTALATTARAGNHTWHAYLSTLPVGGTPGIDARDRIGVGPWRNAKGVLIAQNLTELHGLNNLGKQTALTEKGEIVNGFGDTPNQHDILTGSQPDGTAIAGNVDSTCANWTSSGAGAATLGHSDRTGPNDSASLKSWNSAHPSRGCSVDALKATGGDGRLYCFAVN
jgi:hypothetical protein